MEAGLSDHVWTLEEVALLLEAKNMEAIKKARILQEKVRMNGEIWFLMISPI
jgi:hypothetical protein